MPTTTRKQTAANNAFLAKVKRVFNTPIFRKASMILNTSGQDAAVAYVQQFMSSPVEAGMDDILSIRKTSR